MLYKDQYINKEFTVEQLNILSISNHLKDMYKNKGIDVTEYDKFSMPLSYQEKHTIPYFYENYIMQPLSLLKMDDGSYQLLDGFRRLFCCNDISPDDVGTFYIFNQSDFEENELIYLLTTLNNPKFNGSNGLFIERGITLFFLYNYNINIMTMDNLIYSYMSQNDHNISTYDNRFDNRKVNINNLKERVFASNFISNIKFIDSLLNIYPLLNRVHQIGYLLYELTLTNNLKFDDLSFTKTFLNLYNDGKFFERGSREIAKYNAIFQEVEKVFSSAVGLDIGTTYSDKLEEFKKLRTEFNKKYKKVEFDYHFEQIVKENEYKQPIFKILLEPKTTHENFDYNLVVDVTFMEAERIHHTNSIAPPKLALRTPVYNDDFIKRMEYNIYDKIEVVSTNNIHFKRIVYLVGFTDSKLKQYKNNLKN